MGMSEKKEEIEVLLPFYAMGTLTDEEKARVDEHVTNNPEAKAELDEMIAAAAQLPHIAPPVPPAPQVKADLMARIQADIRQENLSRYHTPVVVMGPVAPLRQSWWERLRLSPLLTTLTGLAVVLALIIGLWGVNQRTQINRLETNLTGLQQEVESLSDQNELLRSNLEQYNQLIAHLGGSTATLMQVVGTEAQPSAQAWLITPDNGDAAALMITYLPPLPEDQVYQFWLIEGDMPVAAGLFEVNRAGEGWLNIEQPVTGFDAVGVSIEPAGGSEEPTGDIVLLGEL